MRNLKSRSLLRRLRLFKFCGNYSAFQFLNGGLGGVLLRSPNRAAVWEPIPFICSGEVNSPDIKVLPPAKRLAPQRGGSLALTKEAEHLAMFQPFSFSMAALAAFCSASFLLRPLPWPMGVPFRSTSTEKILA